MYLLSQQKSSKNCGSFPFSNDWNLFDVLRGQKKLGGNACLVIGESAITHEKFLKSLPGNITSIYVCDINKEQIERLEKKVGDQLGQHQFNYVHIDIFSSQQCKSLAKIICENGHSLGLLNVSNVHQYDRDESLVKSLLTLPCADELAIIYSVAGEPYHSGSGFICTSLSVNSFRALSFFLAVDACLSEKRLDCSINLNFLNALRNVSDETEAIVVQSISSKIDTVGNALLSKVVYSQLFLSEFLDVSAFHLRAKQLFKLHRPSEEMTQFRGETTREEIVARYLLGDCISCFQTDYLEKYGRVASYRKQTIQELSQKIETVISLPEAYQLLYQLKKDNLSHHINHGSFVRFWGGITESRFCLLIDEVIKANTLCYSVATGNFKEYMKLMENPEESENSESRYSQKTSLLA